MKESWLAQIEKFPDMRWESFSHRDFEFIADKLSRPRHVSALR